MTHPEHWQAAMHHVPCWIKLHARRFDKIRDMRHWWLLHRFAAHARHFGR
jgi:hypothetical protein